MFLGKSYTLARIFKLASETCFSFFDFLSFLDAFALQAFHEFVENVGPTESLNFLK